MTSEAAPNPTERSLYDVPPIREGLHYLYENDPVFGRMELTPDLFFWPHMGAEFPALVRIITGQQVSTAAARSLWQRVQTGVPDMTPKTLAGIADEDLRALGLSGQKTSYIKGLARAVSDGALNLSALKDADDAEVIERLTALKGLGPWSAQMYLIFGLARSDVWAPGDLGIRKGVQAYLEIETTPDQSFVAEFGERFAPHRTAASLLLWGLL